MLPLARAQCSVAFVPKQVELVHPDCFVADLRYDLSIDGGDGAKACPGEGCALVNAARRPPFVSLKSSENSRHYHHRHCGLNSVRTVWMPPCPCGCDR